MAHALRYFCSWETERYKHQMRLELWEKDYKGEATAMVLSGEPKLTMEEGDTICGSSLDFGLLSETNGQYLHLYTTDNHKYLIKILRDGAVMWEGYLLPEYYSEAYIAAPYTVNFTATDWLGMLKNIDFPAEDTRVPILQIIKTCLQYTELPLDFACQLDMRVEGINDTTNVLGALYLNPITFTGYNCYEVLEKILAAFNATLRQTGHRWLISSIDDEVPLRLISWDNLTYTVDGESNNGELIGTNFAGTFIDGSMTMAIEPAKKSVDLSQDIFYRESWLKDYDFHSADAWTWPAHSHIFPPGLAYYIKDGVLLEQISVDYLIARRIDSHELLYLSQVINVEGAPDDSEYTLGIKFFTPYDGDNMTALLVKIINRSYTSLTQDVAYLSKDGWTNEESYIELNGTSAEPKYISTHTYNRGGRQYLIYDKENWPTTKINFISIPYTGTLEIRIELWTTTCFGGVYLTKTNITKNLTISSSLNPDAAETASSVNLMLCDSPEERNVELGVLNYFSLSDGALTTGKKWYYNGQEYEDFLHAMAYSYSRCYANKRQKLSGALYTDKIYNLCSFTDKWSGKRHTIKSWTYSIISERLDSMEIIETPAKEIELTLSTPEAGSSNKQNQPSGGTSGGGGATSMAGSGRYVNLDTAQEVSGEKTWNNNANFKKNINVAGDGIFGGEVSGIVGEGTPAGVTDYSALTGKPSINGVTLLSGNNTLDALGIQPKGDYTTASQLATTLENYATKVFVSNNYASKSTVNAIQALIPATASADNQLADKDFVNSSIATATAEFKGSFTSLDELKATSGNLNDYAFYLHTDDVGNKVVDRYKWTTAGWLYEYTLNNSSFTAEQWAALNSTITAKLVQSYNSHLKDTTIHITANERTAWNAKWTYNEETIKAVKVNAAVNADRLIYDAGTSAIPIYFDGGIPVQCTPSALFYGFANGYDASAGGRVLGITIAGHTRKVVVAYSTLAGSADKLATPRTLWGKPFDGSANVSGDLTDVGNITASGKATIQGDIVCGGEVAAIAGEGTPAGVTDYSALTGKPQINGVTLVSGNNTLATLGIQAAGDYATNSGVTTLLANYADKTFVSNNYVGKAAFNNHTADTDIHITSAERAAWNAKWDYNEATIKAVKVTSASSADSVAWTGIKDKPSTFTPSTHTHTASEVSGLPTSLKNPYALTFGSKTYDGSAAATITASDLGALTAHQTIYALTLQVNGTSQGTYNPASAAKTINIAVPTKTSDITNDSGFITSASIPTALKNPYAVEIKANGVSLGTYDGSAAATFNLSAANVGAANKVHTHTASEISGLPTNLSAFTNDVGYITGITKAQVEGVLTGNITSHTHNYLPLSGGTISVNNSSGFNIYITNSIYSAIHFYNTQNSQRVDVGYLGVIGDETPIYINSGGNIRNLLHSGNYNSYAATKNHTHSYAGSNTAGGAAKWLLGAYTANGGQQPPNYFGVNKVGALMMNTNINSNREYKDFIIMDCYSGSDVGGAVAIGVNRQTLGAYIMRSNADRKSWAESAELLGTHNYNSYSPSLTGAGASGTWGINITGNAASATKLQTPRTIWGQSFDGSANVNGKPRFIYATADSSTINENNAAIVLGSGNNNATHYKCGISFNALAYLRGDENGTHAHHSHAWIGLGPYISRDNSELHPLVFATNSSTSTNTALTERMRILPNGNILIGTTTDNGYKLDVNGRGHYSGDLIVDGEVSALVA